jgi:hypothetical protein
MKKLVIMPGAFHPWHAGHTALYNSAKEAFPSADVFVAATADVSSRPFPFGVKQMLAQAAGVPKSRFIQVKSPFAPKEITQIYDPNETQLIFVRSEKDRAESPKPGLIKKDGTPGYLQPYKRNNLEPMSKHGYIAYLPVAQFGPGMTSATEIRAKWPEMTSEQKADLIKTIYPATALNSQAIDKLIEIMDSVLGVAVKEDVIPGDELNLVADISRDLSQLVALLKERNYVEAQNLLTSSIAARMYDLTQLDQPLGIHTAADDDSSADYIEEN